MSSRDSAGKVRAVPSRFEDRAVFVTGAGSGIGQATALRLAAEGASLYLTDLDEVGLEGTAQGCVEQGADVTTRALDVSDEWGVITAIDDCVSLFGRLDCLCNAASVVLVDHLVTTTVDQFRRMIDVNLLGTFLTIRAAVRHLAQTRGNIVNISSTAAVEGVGLAAAYGATKGAISALSRGVAAEFGDQGVRCNAIVPGRIGLPLKASEQIPVSVELSIPGRYTLTPGTPPLAEIAAVVAMVASDDGNHLNGTEIRLDGGWPTPLSATV